ncbi:MAG: glutamate--tRNA ligase [Oscillospiraceae bacterium]|nr:glutamate--tRNA ligase [Oscillospiraceae bacterium]
MLPIRTRFAPSPTGFMHIGNLRSALFEYLIAKFLNGKFIIRIEDTDRSRYVAGSESVIYKTLKLAGIKHDEGPDIGGPYAPYVQSQRREIYLKYASEILSKGGAYYCFCEKEGHSAEGESHGYNRKCRILSQDEINQKLMKNVPYVIRQKMPLEGVSFFKDMVFGEISIKNEELEDQILIKSDGFPTYNFANVVDDHEMNITHVVRGSEYLSSTPKYNLLYDAFGWSIPNYIHLPLILGKNPDGTTSKLSKRNGSVSFQELVSQGFLPEAIVNFIALLGWNPKGEREFFTLEELEKEFTIDRIGKSPSVFDVKKLLWMNFEYMKSKSVENFVEIVENFISNGQSLKKNEIIKVLQGTNRLKLSKILHQRVEKLGDIPEKIDFLFEVKDFNFEIFYNKKSKTTPENVPKILLALIEITKKLKDWSYAGIRSIFSQVASEVGVKDAAVMWVARISVSGLAVTPGGAVEIFEIIGKDQTLQRLEAALQASKLKP